jgi:hypothetical protein
MTGALQRLRLVWLLLASLLCLTTGTFASIRGYDAGGDKFLAAKTTSKVDDIVKQIDEVVESGGKVKINKAGDPIITKGDKRIRIDSNNPHGDRPHFHHEKQMPSGKWKDAGPDHRNYFKEDGQ